jgi:protein-disulfide isomerase
MTMKHSNQSALVAVLSILAFAPACEKFPDHAASSNAAIRAEAPAGDLAAAHAARAEPSEPSECNKPRENCGSEEGADAVAGEVENVNLGTSPSRGPDNAPVTVVVFADFECPFCSKAERTMAQLDADYPGKLRFVFKNNPLPFHKHARLAAKAALAAGTQGKFWEYHDALFTDAKGIDAEALDRRAQDLGLNIDRFRRAIGSDALEAAVDADVAEAKRLDIKGTPTFFVNGRRVKGAQPIDVMRAAIDQALDG